MEHLEKDIKGIEQNRINFYTACLEEFSQLKYNDPYLEEIRADIAKLEQKSTQTPAK